MSPISDHVSPTSFEYSSSLGSLIAMWSIIGPVMKSFFGFFFPLLSLSFISDWSSSLLTHLHWCCNKCIQTYTITQKSGLLFDQLTNQHQEGERAHRTALQHEVSQTSRLRRLFNFNTFQECSWGCPHFKHRKEKYYGMSCGRFYREDMEVVHASFLHVLITGT